MRAMRAARLTTIVALLLVVPVVSGAFAKGPSSPAGPKGLKGFLLRPNESVTHTFPRTPAFSWRPVRSAVCYEFQLATSRTFDGNSVVWSNVSGGTSAARSCTGGKLSIPAIALNLTLPWFTGKPYALYAHVRAITTRGATKWSAPFGFNMRWEELPVPQTTRPGLVRWRPVEGATSYQVWYTDIGKTISTHTNVSDLRELYLFHDDPNWWSTANWRVRAVRHVLGTIPNGLPAVSYGPWSPMYATTNPALTSGKIQLRAAVSDVMSTSWKGSPHQLMPALTFTGNQDLKGSAWPLFRVYAFTDSDCVNVVFRSSVVGGAAFAPRTSGPLELPTGTEEYDLALIGVLKSGKDEKAKTYSADGLEFKTNEALGGEASEAGGSSATASSEQATPQVRVDLPDVDATTTRYFWTVVPVGIRVNDSGTYEYVDIDLAAGRLRDRARLDVRQALQARDHGLANAIRLGPDSQRQAPHGRRRPADGLLDASRRLGARGRSHLLRDPVVEDDVPVARERHPQDALDLEPPPPEAGPLVLPRARAQRRAGRDPGDDLVGPRGDQGRSPDVPGLRVGISPSD